MTIAIGEVISASDVLDEIAAATTPSGVIVMWSGLLANIPSGYVLCDGNNGTPNLLGKFIQGVPTGATNPGGTGGATSKTTTGHTHTNPSTSTAPVHNHTSDTGYASAMAHSGNLVGISSGGDYNCYSIINDHPQHRHNISNDGSHSHTQGSTGSNTDSISDIRPPYYQLAYVMKT